jgi:hypothetical protein
VTIARQERRRGESPGSGSDNAYPEVLHDIRKSKGDAGG